MNTAFNTALKQSSTLRKDLSALSRPSSSPSDPSPSPFAALTPAALGSLSASLTSFTRTLDEYAALAKQELNPAKAAKAHERLQTFRQDLATFRAQFDVLRAARDDLHAAQTRHELLGRRPFASATPENPYAGTAAAAAAATTTGSGYGGGGGLGHARGGTVGGPTGLGSGDGAREAHALREQTFFASTNVALDEYIARGQAVLSDLGQQRDVLKNTQKRLYTVGNTLGISGDTIRMIERRARQDKWIFWAGVVVFFAFCWLVLHYVG